MENKNYRTPAGSMALGGVLAGLAVATMNLGTLIPVATYVCPMLCVVLLRVVARSCGQRVGWAWYGAVAILSALLAPDKEAAAIFLCLGYYPLVKPKLDKTRLPWLWKGLLFNVSILLVYWALMHLLGMAELAAEFEELGVILSLVLLLGGNVTFFLLDKLLGREIWRGRRG